MKTFISVPDINDSVSRVVLSGNQYFVRFTYNDTSGYWKFSLYDALSEPILCGVKIVPNFPLNLFSNVAGLPNGVFFASAKTGKIGRKDFVEGNAKFCYKAF